MDLSTTQIIVVLSIEMAIFIVCFEIAKALGYEKPNRSKEENWDFEKSQKGKIANALIVIGGTIVIFGSAGALMPIAFSYKEWRTGKKVF